jgi:histidine triad (HIT) family protein
MPNNCVFCKISNGEAPAKIRHEDDEVIAFDDINPKTPVHILIIPKKHIESANDLRDEDLEIVGKMFATARDLAKKEGLEDGYKLMVNVGKEGGQLVPHLHLHLLGGKMLRRIDV